MYKLNANCDDALGDAKGNAQLRKLSRAGVQFGRRYSESRRASRCLNPLGGDIIGKEQCQKLQSFIMSMETAKDFSVLFELTTAR